MKWLNGNKTYLGMVALGVTGILFAAGILPESYREAVYALVAAWTGVSMRSAYKKNGR